MKVQIIGPGAMGLVLSYFLSKKNEVCLKVKEGKIRNYENLFIIIKGEKYPIHVKISEDYCDADVSIIALKSYDLQSLEGVKLQGDVIFIQNGLSHLNYKFGKRNFYAVTTWAARKIDTTTAELTGQGYFRIGSLGDKIDLNFLKECGINAEWTDDIVKEMFRKAGINAVINPLTSIYNVKNGAIYEIKFLNFIARALSREIQLLYDKMGINTDVYEDAMNTAKVTKDNFSSMLQDIINNKRTEIESITGEILKLAERERIEMPLNYHLYLTIKSISEQ